MHSLARLTVALFVIASSPAYAQFAPAFGSNSTTAVDPNNPSSITQTTIDPKLGISKIVDHYYYDCLKKKWVWVSREWSKKGDSAFSSDEFTPVAPPKPEYASPKVKELPGGPPPGAQTSPGDPGRAFDPKTGQNFVRQPDGSWIDVKTGKAVGPKLCPCPEPGTTTPPSQPPPPAQPKQPVIPPPTKPLGGSPAKTGEQVGYVPPVKLDPSEKRILDTHNAERVAVGVPPLRWNPALEQSATEYAQQLARTGQRVHAPREGRGDVRENLNQGMLGWNTDQMLRNWLDEKPYFKPGIFPDVSTTGDWSRVGHYSQMIWPTTTDLGCGMASGSGYKWLVCRYSPGGNKEGMPVGQPPARIPERGR